MHAYEVVIAKRWPVFQDGISKPNTYSKYDECNVCRLKNYAIDLSQWTRKSKTRKPGVLKPFPLVHNYAIDLLQWTKKSKISKSGVLNPCLLYIITQLTFHSGQRKAKFRLIKLSF